MDTTMNVTWRARPPLAVSAALALALALAGCGPDPIGGATSPVELVEGVTSEVQAIDNSFRPETVTVQAGTEVVWENGGRNEHNVLPTPPGEGPEDGPEGDAPPEGFGVEADAFPPEEGTYGFRFTEPGTYHYYCSLHGTSQRGMVGTVIVTPGPPDEAGSEDTSS